MPTISEIKPDGTGDFTLLAAWEDWADAQATADQWAECYGGGNLGFCQLAAWTAVADASTYPKIYAAPGQATTGFSDGAYLENTESSAFDSSTIGFFVVSGLRIKATRAFCNNAGSGALLMRSTVGGRVEHCVIDGFGAMGAGISRRASTGSHEVVNCLIRSAELRAVEKLFSGSDWTLQNCTLINHSASAPTADWLRGSCSGSTVGVAPSTIRLNNVILMNLGGGPCNGQSVATTVPRVASHNATSDGTADSYLGGSGNLNNLVAAEQFVNPTGGDYRLRSDSALRHAGTNLFASGVTDDLLGGPRPEAGNFDLGPYQFTASPRGTTSLSRRNRFASLGRPAP